LPITSDAVYDELQKKVDKSSVVDSVTDGDLNPVTSNAVADTLKFSETETICGTWIDGSTLYRKVLIYRIPQNGNYDIPFGVSDAKVRNWRGNFFQASVDNPSWVMHIPYSYINDNYPNFINIYCYYDPAENTFDFQAMGWGQYSQYFNGYAVFFVEYTKN